MKFGKSLFIKWLNSKRGYDVVGKPGNSDACPIATCITQTMEASDVYVNAFDIVFKRKGGQRVYYTPKWASTLIRRVDSTGKANITAEQVKALMKGL